MPKKPIPAASKKTVKPTSSTRSAPPREKNRKRDLPVAPAKPNRQERRLALQDPTKRDETATTATTATDEAATAEAATPESATQSETSSEKPRKTPREKVAKVLNDETPLETPNAKAHKDKPRQTTPEIAASTGLEAPNVEAPNVAMSSAEATKVESSSVVAPSVVAPSVEAPSVEAREEKPRETPLQIAISNKSEATTETPNAEMPVETMVTEAVAEAPIEVKSEAAKPDKPRAKKEKAKPEIVTAKSQDRSESDDDTPAFDELGLNESITRAISALGFETPTPIQARAIPLLLQGRDIIGQAQTGTGKTAAFALPIIQKLDASKRETQALILAPTRELAIQVAGGVYDLAKHTGLRVVPVYGGQPIDRQFRALQQGAHIVVGTPGRVLDHLRRGSLSLDNVSICTLDEADEMLALGFLEDMETILGMLPEDRQLAFFSATMPPRIAALAKRFLRNAETVAIDTKRRTVDAIEQTYYEVPRGKKLEALGRVLDMETPGPTIVFCHTRQETNDLAEALRLRGYSAESLNGEMSQADRERTLRRFRDGQADLLVATDVAARGLDIDSVTHVINYNLPWDVEQYIHRIGRTGRAGRKGDAITLVEARERGKLRFIEQMTGAKIKPARIPTSADIATRRRENFANQLRTALEANEYQSQMSVVEELSDSFDSTEIAAAALQLLWQLQHAGNDDSGEELSSASGRPEGGMTRLQLGLGRQDGLRVGDLVGLISKECGLNARAIGTIELLERATLLEVPSGEVDNVLQVLRDTPFKGRKPKADLATAKE